MKHVVVDLGFGDSGKGATVDFLCRQLNAKVVVRFGGGHQCGHNVQLEDGRRHTFSMFGSGTLAGAHTHLDRNVIIRYQNIKREADALEKLGVSNPRSMMSIDYRCLVTTRMQVAMNRIRNSISGHGTCGMGVGETRAYWLKYGNDAIKAGDKNSGLLEDKMSLMRQRYLQELSDLGIDSGGVFNEEIIRYIKSPSNWREDMGAIRYEMAMLTQKYTVRNGDVYEGHQGVLLDEWFGTHPHTTWSTTHSNDLIEDIGSAFARSQIQVIGCVRSYMTRHGDGPLRTYSKDLCEKLSDPGNPYNAHQKEMRFGYLDVPLLNYAAQITEVDSLAVSHLDEFEKFKPPVYSFHPNRNIYAGKTINLKRKEQTLTRGLEIRHVQEEDADLMTTDELLGHLSSHVAPVGIKAYGPAASHRSFA